MTAFSWSKRHLSVAHLPGEMRIPVQALSVCYLFIGTLIAGRLVHDYMFLDEHLHVFLNMCRVALLLVTFLNLHLVRRGGIRLGTLLYALVLLCISSSYTWTYGGMTSIVCVTLLPIVVLMFTRNKRDILFATGAVYLVNTGVHLWVSVASAGDFPVPIYEFKVALISYTVLMVATMLVTMLCAHINMTSIQQISQSTRELTDARALVKQRSLDAEQAREKTMLAQRAKSRFLANMSHELRTPLNTIIGYADLLEEEFDEADLPAVHLEDVHHIRQAGAQLLTLINDILDLSRLEAEKMPLTLQRVTLRELWASTHRIICERFSHEPPIRLPDWPHLPIDLEELVVHVDEQLTIKALGHLVLDAMLKGHVHVTVAMEPARLCVCCEVIEPFQDEIVEELHVLYAQLNHHIHHNLTRLLGYEKHETSRKVSLFIPVIQSDDVRATS